MVCKNTMPEVRSWRNLRDQGVRVQGRTDSAATHQVLPNYGGEKDERTIPSSQLETYILETELLSIRGKCRKRRWRKLAVLGCRNLLSEWVPLPFRHTCLGEHLKTD